MKIDHLSREELVKLANDILDLIELKDKNTLNNEEFLKEIDELKKEYIKTYENFSTKCSLELSFTVVISPEDISSGDELCIIDESLQDVTDLDIESLVRKDAKIKKLLKNSKNKCKKLEEKVYNLAKKYNLEESKVWEILGEDDY